MKKKSTAWLVLIALIVNLSFCIKAAWAEDYTIPELDAESAVLMDARTGQVLFAKNMNKKQFPASITKIMTAMLALEKGKLNDLITMSDNAVFSILRGSSHIALNPGEKLLLEDALYALAIESANDAANGIAEYIAADGESFAALMNKRSEELGALNTHFVNAHGLDDPEHYTTAYDMAVIMRQAIKTPEFKQIFSAAYYEMMPTNLQTESRYFHNKNSLLNGKYQYEGIVASKLGWTSKANNTLVSAASRGGRDLIVAVMNSQAYQGTYQDTMQLLDYGFNDFIEVTVLSTDAAESIPMINNNGTEENVGNVIIETAEPVRRLLHKSLTGDDLAVNYKILEPSNKESIKTEISFNLKQKNDYMYEDLGSSTIVSPAEPPAAYITNSVWDGIKSLLYFLLKAFKILLVVFLSLLAVVLILRQINLKRLKKKGMAAGRQYKINDLYSHLNKHDLGR